MRAICSTNEASMSARSDGARPAQAWKPERETPRTRHMSEIEWLALSAAMNRNTLTASRSPHEEGRCFFQDLPPTQLPQLLTLILRQAVALAPFDLRLLHPQPQRLPRNTEIVGELAERAIGPAVERHRLAAKLRRIRLSVLRLPWHGRT